MKVKFLLQHVELEDNLAIACLSNGLFAPGYSTRAEATEEMKTILKAYLDSEGKAYVQNWMGSSRTVNCPEGYIKLPIDIWCCKLTHSPCNLQAQVTLQDQALFISTCAAPENKKAGIFNAVTDGRYNGFHHVPGRNLCPTCQGDTDEHNPFNYHYHFELTLVPKLFGIAKEREFESLRREASYSGLPSYALACGLCPPCAMRVVSSLDKSFSNDLEIVEMDFFPR